MLFSKKLLFFQNFYPKLITSVGTTNVLLVPGTYRVTIRGSGGAGGNTAGNVSSAAGGTGGAGGKGDIQSTIVQVTRPLTALATIGEPGKTKANGGNGGNGGANNGGGSSSGAAGGGGALPSSFTVDTDTFYVTGGGGGGGGGGAGTSYQSRYSGGAGGGGGGGYYRIKETPVVTIEETTSRDLFLYFDWSNYNIMSGTGTTSLYEITEARYNEENPVGNTLVAWKIDAGTPLAVGDTFVLTAEGYEEQPSTLTVTQIDGADVTFSAVMTLLQTPSASCTIQNLLTAGPVTGVTYSVESVPGKNGANGASAFDPVDGATGNTTDFPGIRAGRGHNGYDWQNTWRDYYSNYVYGGGASGGGGGGANWNTDYSTGGGGGGGAGGSPDAGSGGGGAGWRAGEAGTNYHTTPTDTTAENAEYGVTGNYGMGGATATNGTGGFILIERIPNVVTRIEDCGLITGAVDETMDLGGVDEPTTETIDCGNII